MGEGWEGEGGGESPPEWIVERGSASPAYLDPFDSTTRWVGVASCLDGGSDRTAGYDFSRTKGKLSMMQRGEEGCPKAEYVVWYMDEARGELKYKVGLISHPE